MATLVRVEPKGFNGKQLALLEEARTILEKVINHDEFKKRVLNFSYPYSTGSLWWKKWYTSQGFRWNNGDDRQTIYTKVLSGDEMGTGSDQEIDVKITVYTGDAGVLGYTNPGTLRTWINSKFLDTASAAEIAGNLIHEYCHKTGYDHEYYYNSLRQYTVPYAIGYLVTEIARELAKKDPLFGLIC